MVRENFFILLELPFDPPPDDPAEIKAAIQKKHREWSRMHDNPRTSSAALQYMELIPEMEQVLLDPAARQEEAAEAQELRLQMLGPFEAELRLLEGKGYLHPRELKALGKKYGPFGIDSLQIRAALTAPITDNAPKEPALSELGLALNYDTILEIRGHLEVMDQPDLYSFLGYPATATSATLVSAAQKLQHESFHATEKTGKTAATQLLADLSMKALENDSSKLAYDTFLQVNDYPRLADLITEEHRRNGYISPEMLMRLVNFGVTTYGIGVLELEEYIRRFCRAYHISVDIVSPEITCPNCHGQSPRGTPFCLHCAAPLEGKCPECGTFFSDGASVCTNCSFPIGSMGKAVPYLEQADAALIENNWSSAKHAISYIQQYWPDHPKLEQLRMQTDDVEERYGETLKEIETALYENRYYAASELAAQAENRRLQLPPEIIRMIHGTINEFEGQIAEIKKRGQASFESLHALAGHVSDSLELGRMLSKYPPEPPTRFTARPAGNTVQLSWGKSPSAGNLHFVVVRKEDSVPLTAFDGDILYTGEENTFLDEHVPALKNYFYSVFVKRGHSFSEMGAVAAASVRIIPELADFIITPGDGAAQMTWLPPADLKEVIIWRKLGGERPTSAGEGIQLENTRLDGFTDRKVKNDVEYWYYLVAVYYNQEIGQVESQGICHSITPRKLVSPIDYFTITRDDQQEDSYLVNWDTTRDEVIFFHSLTKPAIHPGQMIPTADLLRNYNRLLLEQQTGTSARFRLRFSGGSYIFPVAVSGQFGAMGSSYYLTNVPDVEQLTYDIIDSDLFVNFRWPTGPMQAVRVTWRGDSFPTSPEQKGTHSVTCSREQYDLDAGVRIPEITTGRYYLTIYSTFVSPEGQVVFSPGEDLLVDNTPAREFFYTVRYSKGLFSSTHTVSITVESPEKFHLPRALLVGKEGQIPLSITDGNPLFEIEREQDVSGSITYEYKSDKLPKNLFIRLFFFDETHYQRLRPIPGKSLQIT